MYKLVNIGPIFLRVLLFTSPYNRTAALACAAHELASDNFYTPEVVGHMGYANRLSQLRALLHPSCDVRWDRCTSMSRLLQTLADVAALDPKHTSHQQTQQAGVFGGSVTSLLVSESLTQQMYSLQ